MSQSAEVIDRFAQAIAVDRHFDAAVVSYIEALVVWRRGLGNYNKVVACSARHRIMKSVLRLHFGNATDNPDDGATFERLLALANLSDDESCGPRVLRTVIGLAQRTGHLEVSQGWFDRRLKILRPTEKWIAQEAERHDAALKSLRLLLDERTRHLMAPRGAALVARLATAANFDCALGLTVGAPDGGLRAIMALDGGIATALSVADAFLRGKRIPSHKEIGASFRLSASQARKILHIGADYGLIGFDRNGKISEAAGLVAQCRRLIAHELAIYARAVIVTRPHEEEFLLPAPALSPGAQEHVH